MVWLPNGCILKRSDTLDRKSHLYPDGVRGKLQQLQHLYSQNDRMYLRLTRDKGGKNNPAMQTLQNIKVLSGPRDIVHLSMQTSRPDLHHNISSSDSKTAGETKPQRTSPAMSRPCRKPKSGTTTKRKSLYEGDRKVRATNHVMMTGPCRV